MNQLPKLILIRPERHGTIELRRSPATRNTLQPAKPQVFHVQPSIDPVSTTPAARPDPRMQTRNTCFTYPQSPRRDQRVTANKTLTGKDGCYQVSNNSASHLERTSEHPRYGSPTAFSESNGRVQLFRPPGRTSCTSSELLLQAFAEDSPTRRRSRSVRPRHARSISPSRYCASINLSVRSLAGTLPQSRVEQ